MKIDATMELRVIREAARTAAKDMGYSDLRPQQLKIIESFVKGRDVFAFYTRDTAKACAMDVCHLCLTSYYILKSKIHLSWWS